VTFKEVLYAAKTPKGERCLVARLGARRRGSPGEFLVARENAASPLAGGDVLRTSGEAPRRTHPHVHF